MNSIQVLAKAFYKSQGPTDNNAKAPAEDMLADLIRVFGGSGSDNGLHDANATVSNTPFNESFYNDDYQRLKEKDQDNTQLERPKAYLNFVLFDDDFKLVEGNSGVRQVKQDPDQLQQLDVQKMPIEKSGFLYVYTSNESQQDVFFDNVVALVSSGPLLEETHYYPYGLAMAGIGSNALKGTNYRENRIKYNGNELQSKEFADGSGLELYDFNARTYDAQLGRFLSIDPSQESAANWTGYRFAFDNPVLNNDPSGLWEGTYNRGSSSFDEILTSIENNTFNINAGDDDKDKGKDNIRPQSQNAFAPALLPLFGELVALFGGMSAIGPSSNLDLEALSNSLKYDWQHSVTGELINYLNYTIDQYNIAQEQRLSRVPHYDPAMAKTMYDEIVRIVSNGLQQKGIVYKLIARSDGMFNIYVRGSKLPVGQKPLKKGDIWKYGETTNEEDRYDDKTLTRENVDLVPIASGTQMQLKIMEKLLIYGYYFQNGHRPYGNKLLNMDVSFTGEYSAEVQPKFGFIADASPSPEIYFKDRDYGGDLSSLIIAVNCFSPKFEPFFKMRSPKYEKEARTYVYDGMQGISNPNHFSYELRLPFDAVFVTDDIKPFFAERVLSSLDVISTINEIKDFDLEKFKADFELFFKENGWI